LAQLPAGCVDPSQGQCVANALISKLRGIGQFQVRWNATCPHVKKLGLIGQKKASNILGKLAPRQLGQRHDAKKLGTKRCAQSSIVSWTRAHAAESHAKHKVLALLREQGAACAHGLFLVMAFLEQAQYAQQNSNHQNP